MLAYYREQTSISPTVGEAFLTTFLADSLAFSNNWVDCLNWMYDKLTDQTNVIVCNIGLPQLTFRYKKPIPVHSLYRTCITPPLILVLQFFFTRLTSIQVAQHEWNSEKADSTLEAQCDAPCATVFGKEFIGPKNIVLQLTSLVLFLLGRLPSFRCGS